MKAKTIKAILTKVHKDWVNSITDPEVKRLVRRDTIITGGCIASMLLREPVNDFDVYFTTKETILKTAKYYVDQFQELNKDKETLLGPTSSTETYKLDIVILDEGDRVKIKVKNTTREDTNVRPAAEKDFTFSEDPDEDTVTHVEDKSNAKLPKYRPVYMSANAITLSDKIQIVIRFYGDAETIHKNYDFEHTKCYWTAKDKKLVLPASALEALITKELVYTGSKYPLASIIRTRKFINRGFTINAGQYLKMCLQLNDIDLKHLPTLEDQLIGMDAIYFAQMIAAIPADKRIDDRLDTHYVMELINRFF